MSNPFIHDEADIAERMIWNYQNSKSYCSIAKVTQINASPVSVNIQPLVNYFDRVANWQPYPILNNIPVAQMQTGSYSINTPLNVGDIGLTIWFDREVYTCLLSGATTPTTPDSGNLADTNACIFVPIVQSFSSANVLVPQGVDITSVHAGTPISLMTQLLTLLDGLSTFITTMQTVSNFGAINTAATSLLPILNTLVTNLTNFKGAQP